MVSPEHSHFHVSTPMAKSAFRNRPSSLFSDALLFAGGAMSALLVIWALSPFNLTTLPNPNPNPAPTYSAAQSRPSAALQTAIDCPTRPKGCDDPPEPTFYDDPGLSYRIGHPIEDWDRKRREWLRLHPWAGAGPDGSASDRVVLLSGSQPGPCRNPIGDHLLLRFFKNKVDYCRLHGCDVVYNNAHLHPKMGSFWAKLPLVRAAMVAHPEAEWIWWVDSDAAFTDMEFQLPLRRYRRHNLVVHGWSRLIYDDRSWTSLNAGVFLIRNCQWSLDLIEVWASMGPQSPDYEEWGRIQRSTFKDKLFPGSDDQAALIYLMLKEKDKWADRIYLEAEYYFEGYWVDIVGSLDNTTRRYEEMERRVRRLRRRRAEKVGGCYGALREEYLDREGAGSGGKGSWRRPFITHFTGCQPCSGDHNQMYSGESCWKGMQRALNFADNQVLRSYGYMHPDALDPASVSPLPFDYPA